MAENETSIAYVRDLPAGVLARIQAEAAKAGAIGADKSAAGPALRWAACEFVRLLELCECRKLDGRTLAPLRGR